MDELLKQSRWAFWGSTVCSIMFCIIAIIGFVMEGAERTNGTMAFPFLCAGIALVFVQQVGGVQLRLIKHLRQQDEQPASDPSAT